MLKNFYFKNIFHISYTKVLCLLLLTIIIFFTIRTQYLYDKINTFETCRESINFMIQHKTTFLLIYKFNHFREYIINYFYEPPKKSYYEALASWVEERIMTHIEHHDNVATIDDLPWIERSAIKALDGSSYLSTLYQRFLYYITGAQR